MKRTLRYHTRRSGITLAVVVALSTLGTTNALAQTFAKADISIAPRTNESKEIAAGDLTCSWQETGLGSYQVITYNCSAEAVGVLEGCVYKNKLISSTVLSTFTDINGGEHGEGAVFISNNSGRINGSATTAVHESHGGGEGLCPEIGATNGEGGQQPEVEVLAIRWCNATLTDTTNNIIGTTKSELFEEFVPGGDIPIPSCNQLLSPSPSP